MLSKIKFILIITFLTSSLNAHAFFLEDIWDRLTAFLKINYTKTVNETVSPPAPPCVTSHEVNSPDQTFADEGEEREVGFTPKEDSDADNARESLIKNFEKLGGDPIALKQALCFYDRNRGQNFKAEGDPSRAGGIKIQNQRFITINDLNKSYFQSRMFVLDLDTGKVKSYYSSHGIGGKHGVKESGAFAEEFSNQDGSNATPRGFFITGSRVNGSSDPKQRWKFSMKLHGLQDGVNDNSYSRAVVMHSFPDVTNDVASSDDEKPNLRVDPYPFYLSKGCTMVGPEVANEIIDTIKAPNNKSGGSLYYNYSPVEKSYGESFCGDEGLLKK